MAEKVNVLKRKLTEGDFSALKDIRETVLQLNAPPQLVCCLSFRLIIDLIGKHILSFDYYSSGIAENIVLSFICFVTRW